MKILETSLPYTQTTGRLMVSTYEVDSSPLDKGCANKYETLLQSLPISPRGELICAGTAVARDTGSFPWTSTGDVQVSKLVDRSMAIQNV